MCIFSKDKLIILKINGDNKNYLNYMPYHSQAFDVVSFYTLKEIVVMIIPFSLLARVAYVNLFVV